MEDQQSQYRGFLAIPLPEAIKTYLHERVEVLKKHMDASSRVRWVPKDNYHLTIQFLGKTESVLGEKIVEALQHIFHQSGELSLSLHKLFYIPTLKNPRVLACLVRPIKDLIHIYYQTEKILAEFGFEPEHRSFIPHITLARLDQALPVDIHAIDWEHKPFSVNAMTLFRSECGDCPTHYEAIKSIEFE